MTKVRMNSDLLEYRQGMKEDLRQVLRQNYITGVPRPFVEGTVLAQEHVLPPPYIGFIALDGYSGQGDDYIGFVGSHEFGIYSMHITIMDDRGHVIESGEASPFIEDPNGWEYLPEAVVPPGTTVTILITAVDCMGGIGRGWERKTINGPGNSRAGKG